MECSLTAATRLAPDLAAFTGIATTRLGNLAARDTSLLMRGDLLDRHPEFRAGVFEGPRQQATAQSMPNRGPPRASARLQWNLLDPDMGFQHK